MNRAARLVVRAGLLCAACLALGACVSDSGTGGTASTPPQQPAQADVTAYADQSLPKGTYLKAGLNLLEAHEPDLAYQAFVASMRVDGISAQALIGAGIAQQQQGLMVSAKQYLKQAVEADPDSIPANNNLGVVLFKLNEYYPARDAFRTAYALSSGRSEVAERNLNRVQAIIAQIDGSGQQDPDVSHRVVRLGTSEFRITPIEKSSAEIIGAE